jgi:hypothetical protein
MRPGALLRHSTSTRSQSKHFATLERSFPQENAG